MIPAPESCSQQDSVPPGFAALGGTVISYHVGTGCSSMKLKAVSPPACLPGDALDTGWGDKK